MSAERLDDAGRATIEGLEPPLEPAPVETMIPFED